MQRGRRIAQTLGKAVEVLPERGFRALEALHENRTRNLNERLREDDRHNTRVVHTKRHERLLHPVGVAARNAAARRVNRHLADTLRQHHRAHHDEDEEDDNDREFRNRRVRLNAGETEVTLPGIDDRLRQTRGDVDHDDERSTVANAERRDLISEPHHEQGSGRHADHRDEMEPETGIRHNLNELLPVREPNAEPRHLEDRRNAPRLHDAEDNRQVTRNLRELHTARLTFLLELLKRRDDGRKELNHDLRRNVGPDREKADRALTERATREYLKYVKKAAAVRIRRAHIGNRL